jgi:hypothetical protein
MATTALAHPVPLSRTVDAIADSVERLERLLPRREDAEVLLDFLEDDLREGLDAAQEVEAHFTDVLDALRDQKVSPATLLDAAEDWRVLNRLEYLTVVVTQLRKRLSQAAGQLRVSPVARSLPLPPLPDDEP